MRMVHEGVVSLELMQLLLRDCSQNVPFLVRLMAKFGLIVPLRGESGESDDGALAAEYLVPALLPTAEEAGSHKASAGVIASDSSVDTVAAATPTCLFVFTCSAALHPAGGTSAVLSYADIARLGFLPRGLFERLLCKAVAWCNGSDSTDNATFDSTSADPAAPPLYQDTAELQYRNQRFTLSAHYSTNCIELRVPSCERGQVQNQSQGMTAAIHAAVAAQLQQIVSECMRSLRFFSALPYTRGDCADTEAVLVPFDSILSVDKGLQAEVCGEEVLRLLAVWVYEK